MFSALLGVALGAGSVAALAFTGAWLLVVYANIGTRLATMAFMWRLGFALSTLATVGIVVAHHPTPAVRGELVGVWTGTALLAVYAYLVRRSWRCAGSDRQAEPTRQAREPRV